jgi:hypothetical protein
VKEPYQTEILRQYVVYCVESKDVRPTKFHHHYKPYNRKQSTIDLINRAIERQILFEPRLLCLPDIEVEFVEYKDVPLIDLYEKKKNDPNITYAMVLTGAYSLLCFRYGLRSLTYAACITPSYPAQIYFDEIDPVKYGAGKLPEMPKPENWDDLDWEVYKERNCPTASSTKIGQKLNVSYKTVLNHYEKILKDCQIWIPFFPNGYADYVPYVITLKTDYETGIVNELKKLDRSSYVYKVDDTLILTLFFDGCLEIESFLHLEKNRVIHDVRVSFPLRHCDKFW